MVSYPHDLFYQLQNGIECASLVTRNSLFHRGILIFERFLYVEPDALSSCLNPLVLFSLLKPDRMTLFLLYGTAHQIQDEIITIIVHMY